jgi:hypothetical protein
LHIGQIVSTAACFGYLKDKSIACALQDRRRPSNPSREHARSSPQMKIPACAGIRILAEREEFKSLLFSIRYKLHTIFYTMISVNSVS